MLPMVYFERAQVQCDRVQDKILASENILIGCGEQCFKRVKSDSINIQKDIVKENNNCFWSVKCANQLR